jgi:hypothetical protein
MKHVPNKIEKIESKIKEREIKNDKYDEEEVSEVIKTKEPIIKKINKTRLSVQNISKDGLLIFYHVLIF